MGLKKSKFEFAVAGTLYSTDGPKFTNRDPDYSGSYVDKAYSFNGSVSYYAKKSKTTLGYRTYKTPMGWGTYSNSPTMYLGLPSQGYNNQGILGIIQRDIRGEKSGLDDSYLRTLFIQNEFKPNEKLNFLSRVTYRETGIGEDSYIYVTADGRQAHPSPVLPVIPTGFQESFQQIILLLKSIGFLQGFSFTGIMWKRGPGNQPLILLLFILLMAGIQLPIFTQLFYPGYMI